MIWQGMTNAEHLADCERLEAQRKRRHIKHHREYKGCTIWFNDQAGPRLRWTSSTCYRANIAADTLAGIKRMISEDMDMRSRP